MTTEENNNNTDTVTETVSKGRLCVADFAVVNSSSIELASVSERPQE